MAEPLLELCPHCGAHFRPREAILQRIGQLETQLREALEDGDELESEVAELRGTDRRRLDTSVSRKAPTERSKTKKGQDSA